MSFFVDYRSLNTHCFFVVFASMIILYPDWFFFCKCYSYVAFIFSNVSLANFVFFCPYCS